MRSTLTIFRKEMLGYFNSAIAYIFFTLFLILLSFLFFRVYFLQGIVSMNDFFGVMPWVFLIFVPAVTMKSWAEERKSGTMEVLLTMPALDTELVIGKFLAGAAFVGIAILLTLIVPLLVAVTGPLDWGTVVASYLGALLLAAAYVAIGNFVSSLTANQITAFLFTAVILFLLLIIGTEPVYSVFPNLIAEVVRNFSLNYHFQSIGRGVLDSRDLLFYFSLIGLFVYYNVKSLEARNW